MLLNKYARTFGLVCLSISKCMSTDKVSNEVTFNFKCNTYPVILLDATKLIVSLIFCKMINMQLKDRNYIRWMMPCQLT